jgi:hypothetical protein
MKRSGGPGSYLKRRNREGGERERWERSNEGGFRGCGAVRQRRVGRIPKGY